MKDKDVIEPQWGRDDRDVTAVRDAARQLADLQGRWRDASFDDSDVVELRGGGRRARRDASFGDPDVVELRGGRRRDVSLEEPDVVELRGGVGGRRRGDVPFGDPDVVELRGSGRRRRRNASFDDSNVVELRSGRRRRDASLGDPDVVELREDDYPPSARGKAGAAAGRQTQSAAPGAERQATTPAVAGSGRQEYPSAGNRTSASSYADTGYGASVGRADTDDEEEQEDSFAERPEPSTFKKYLSGLLSGSILTREELRRNYKYLIALVALMLGYMAYTFDFQRLYRREERLTDQVRELRAQAMTLSSMRMNATRESVISAELVRRNSDVKESVTPPKVIEK